MNQDDEKNMGVVQREFLKLYLLDSSEEIERLGASLLQLEKEGGNIELINDLFRSVHSLKGASGTMGFTPIVALTHLVEDLLDRLRQGKLEVSLGMIDILLAVTDRLKAMLAQVEQRLEITIGAEDLVSSMRVLLKREDDEDGMEKFVPLNFSDSAPSTIEVSRGEGNSQVHTVRVDTVRMDNLINLVEEMATARTRLMQIGLDLKAQYSMDSMVNYLNETNDYLGRLMDDLQENVMSLRMVAIRTVFSRFPRLVRDLAKKTGKEMELVLKGEDTELDKTVVEAIGDPLMHLIRNSVDHGIESPEERRAAGKPEKGRITLNAYHEGNNIVIVISDDGAGLNLEKIRSIAISKGLVGEREELSERDISILIFLPGFSTADKVTDISGRGVGMDVLKKALTNLGGMVDITTQKGQGTTFTIRLPLTLATIQALLLEVWSDI